MEQELAKTGLRAMESYYEPLMNADYGSVVAYRTHVRINDPEMGVLLPRYYMPSAERTTLANRISRWSAEDVALTVPKLKKRGVFFEFISVYVPQKLFLTEDFVPNFIRHITDCGAEPGDLAVELSPAVFASDLKPLRKNLEALKDVGIKTLLSGFGTGTAFIGRLEQLHFDYIMLEGFLSAYLICDDERKLAMAQSLFELVAAQGSSPIACGVSNSDIQSALPKSCVLFGGSRAGRVKRASGIR